MNEQDLHSYLNNKLNTEVYTSGGLSTKDAAYVVICGQFLNEHFITYSNEIEVKWSRIIVEVVRSILRRDNSSTAEDYYVEDLESYCLAFNFLSMCGWCFGWGSNIYNARINWELAPLAECSERLNKETIERMFKWLDTIEN